MGDEPAGTSTGEITADAVSNRSFTSAFRGFHPGEVRQYLKAVGDELAAAAGREVELRRALQEALNRAAHPELNEATVTTVLGEHAARLLASARETAASITDEAQKRADGVLREAEIRVARMRDESEGLLARRMAEADAARDGIQRAAETDAQLMTDQARAEAETLTEAAKERGKEMVAEARDLRERMLGDLARRRRAAQVQVEQLRAAQERLMAAFDVVRHTVDEATSELAAAEPEARLAAEAVARRAGEYDMPALIRPDESDLPVRAGRAAPPRGAQTAVASALPSAAGASGPPTTEPAPRRAAALTQPVPPTGAQAPLVPAPAASASPALATPPDPTGPQPAAPVTPHVAASAVPRAQPATISAPTAGQSGPPSPAETSISSPPAAAASAGRPLPASAVTADDRAVSLVATPGARPADAPRSAVASVGEPGPPRRPLASAPPPPDRPPMRPQTVADAVGRKLNQTPPVPPPPPRAPVSRPVPAPVAHSELSTMEPPAVPVEEPAPNGNGHANGNGNGNGHGKGLTDKPVTKVDDLFARMRADRSSAPSPPRPPEPVPPAAPAGIAPSHLDPISSEHALARRDELLDEVEAGLTRALKRVLQDEQNELLDRLRRLGSASTSAEAVLATSDDQRAAYRAVAVRWMDEAARAGVRFASGTGPRPETQIADPSVDALAEDLATTLIGPLRDRVTRILDDADDQTAAAESVRAVYRQWKVQHVEESARHHVLIAFNVGAFITVADGALLQWLVDDDGHCPDCDDNVLAGPTVKGQAFPTGQLHPPAHLGCRCLLVPAGSPRPT